MVARLQHALECHVQGVGAVQREDEPFRCPTVEEPVKPMSAVVEGMFRGEGHLVTGPARVGNARPPESVHGLVDGLRLRERRRGVVEVNGHCTSGPLDYQWPMYLAYSVRAFSVSSVPLMIARPSGKTVNSYSAPASRSWNFRRNLLKLTWPDTPSCRARSSKFKRPDTRCDT